MFKILPFGAIYFISDILSFFLHKIISYRKSVIYKNLSFVFPEKTENERKKIAALFYKELADFTLESLAAYSKHPSKIIPRLQFANPQLIEEHYHQGRPLVVMGAHFNNWEYPNITIPSQQKFTVASMVKPISNDWINQFINKKRSATGAEMLSIYGSQRALVRKNKNPRAFVYISDQYPPNQDRAIEAQFFKQATKFLHGGQQIARKKNYPLYGVKIEKVRRGFYEMHMELLEEKPASKSEKELTQMYANYLETMITEKPECWLWSHKRWKKQIKY